MGESFLRAETRSVLSRNRVELSLLRVGVFGNVIRLQGVLRRAAGLPEMTHEALENLEREIRRIPGVRRVEMHLSNWQRRDSEWTPTGTAVLESVEPDPRVGKPSTDAAWPNWSGARILPA
jgi:hypothetical protein